MKRLALIAMLVTACSQPGSWIPTRPVPDLGGPAALTYGTLVDVNGCVYIDSHDQNLYYLVVWPFGFKRSGDLILDLSGKPVAKIGQWVVLGGGKALRPDGVPEGCDFEGGWGAHNVNPSLPPGVVPTPPP